MLRRIGLLITIAAVVAVLGALLPAVPVMAAQGTLSYAAGSAQTGPVGTSITINGSGYTLGGTYTVFVGGAAAASGSVAGGSFGPITFSVPTVPWGAQTITATTSGGDTTAAGGTLTFTVSPQITVSPLSGQVGDVFSVYGTGFAATTTVTTTLGLTNLGSTATSAAGTFTVSFVVPSAPHTVVPYIVSSTDGYSHNAQSTFTILPKMTLSAASAAVGAQVTVTGSGYAATAAVVIYFDGTSVASVTTDTTGNFSYILTVPSKPKGNYPVTASDSYGDNVSATLAVTSTARVNPTAFTSGTQITLSGSGFTATTPIALSIDDTVVNATLTTTDATGNFSVAYTVPALPGGTHTLGISDSYGNTGSFAFSVSSSVTISPTTGLAGATVQATGVGFGAGTNITITFDGATISLSAVPTTDSSGKFNASFKIPAAAGGSHNIVFSDGTLSASASFAVTAVGGIDVTRGSVGQAVTASGTSFGSKATVNVTWDGSTIMQGTADNSGSFSITFNVPQSATGNHTVAATDGTRNLSFTFSVTPTASITPTSGNVGTPVTVNGTGFAASARITVRYDENTAAALNSTSVGSFAVVFNAPASKGGNHSVIITDGTSTITTTFAMDSTPPPVPSLVSPLNDTHATPTPEFQWTAVQDPSTVTYEFQLSRDENFSVPLMDKTGLTNPGYLTTPAEELASVSRSKPYFWRVRAVDGASNASEWSRPQTFYVGVVIPPWVQYVVAGVVVVIVGVLAFLLGLRAGRGRRVGSP